MNKINLQLSEKKTSAENGDLEIFKIWRTIQGEGEFSGMPAIFIRTAGCNLKCPGCDTDYTSKRKWYSVEQLVNAVQVLMPDFYPPLIVITGGEPFRQNLLPFLFALRDLDMIVTIESNGSLVQPHMNDPEIIQKLTEGWFNVCCSPKVAKVHPDLRPYIGSYKYILDAEHVDPTDGLPTQVLGLDVSPARPHNNFDKTYVFIQPADEMDPERNQRNVEAAVKSCMKYGYRISLQTHKILGVE